MKILMTCTLTLAALSLVSGCTGQPAGSVTGQLLIDGQPTGGFEIHYISQSTGMVGIGYSHADGRYEIFQGRGNRQLNVGDYKVTVAPTDDVAGVSTPKIRLPKTYTDRSQTTLIKNVAPGANEIDLELTSEGK